MERAIALAGRNLGLVWPNPSVGCVVVQDGQIVSEAATGVGGRPHAEAIALQDLDGDITEGSTIYVSLEPCCHWGRTPPCTQAVIAAKPKKVVIAVLDSDPRMRGSGVAQIREAGIEVELGLCEDDALRQNEGFFHRIRTGMPMITTLGPEHNFEEVVRTFDATLATRGAGLFVSFEFHRRRRSRYNTTDWLLTAADRAHTDVADLGGIELLTLSTPEARERELITEALRAMGHRGLTRVLVDGVDPLAQKLEKLGFVQVRLD